MGWKEFGWIELNDLYFWCRCNQTLNPFDLFDKIIGSVIVAKQSFPP